MSVRLNKMLWKGRFTKKMAGSMQRLNWSLPVDIRLLPYEIKIDEAYADELLHLKIYNKEEHQKLLAALKALSSEFEAGKFDTLPDDEDVHSLVERRLFELAGEAGHKIHTGRSRNEMVITETKLFLKDELKKTEEEVLGLLSAIIQLAEKNLDSVMPGYTHLQHAQPVLFSHYLLSFAFALDGDIKRISAFLEGSVDSLPLGSGAFAGTAFQIDRKRLAARLGFKEISANSINAVSSRDEFLETAAVLSMMMVHLSRYAEDLILWSSSEFGFIELDESVSTGSSMMPQKKNPDSLELIRGKTARVLGNMNGLFALLKGLPLTYARDLQEDKEPLFDSFKQARLSLEVFKDVISTLKINKEKMLAGIEGGLFATDLADYLARKGLPFRECHEVVAGIVRDCCKNKTKLDELTLDDFKKYSELFGQDIFECFDPITSINKRNAIGGTSLASVKEQIKELNHTIQRF